ncbi:hypothetical protein SAMN05216179_3576 [Gracilibacillus kekensis]|uniref:Uncharacterized protein n=1 Tax=Gracilibacillus kekensis TaxID=1027249 RepID=A0A1M7QUC5_9BACI|nr:hypothetical protein SAMN05216179_3576 [Gracilibacillus kekensis]
MKSNNDVIKQLHNELTVIFKELHVIKHLTLRIRKTF